MKVETFLFGTVEVQPEQVFEFRDGLVSFEDCKQFMLIHETDTGGEPVSFTLQSLDNPAVALQIIDPVTLGFTYELALTDDEIAKIKLTDPADVAVMLVLFKQDAAAPGISANLRAPLIVNTKARLGIQKVLTQVRPNVLLSNLSNPV
ncbi:MAG: flagellar assembly protein FliW [Azovibrio sp.]